ncbi:MAG: hypothetical protein HOQ11_03440 [Gemmatimonadaceae bacterium]|nr:hypothetical protein [Gemmatimonadaceae bacterium]NUQ93352.1 hypothetical protein [Gemmatimonadaceae bacterium]NUR19113.1 hypothetical protein [Gemmatimonadaceae bacterium]NUS96444.1 hypothetical protein [Gemmatimonadaceae bacterium]
MRGSLLLALAFTLACASAPVDRSAPTTISTTRISGGAQSGQTAITTTTVSPTATVDVAAPLAKTWVALRAVYDSLGIPVSTVDESQHLMGNTGIKVRRTLGKTPLMRLLDCGHAQGGPNAETYEVFFAVATQLRPTADGARTLASTSLQAQARPVSFAGEYVACTTTGGLESRIADLLKQLAQG